MINPTKVIFFYASVFDNFTVADFRMLRILNKLLEENEAEMINLGEDENTDTVETEIPPSIPPPKKFKSKSTKFPCLQLNLSLCAFVHQVIKELEIAFCRRTRRHVVCLNNNVGRSRVWSITAELLSSPLTRVVMSRLWTTCNTRICAWIYWEILSGTEPSR